MKTNSSGFNIFKQFFIISNGQFYLVRKNMFEDIHTIKRGYSKFFLYV